MNLQLILLWLGCQSPSENPKELSQSETNEIINTMVDDEVLGEGTIEPELEAKARYRMRMNIDQLKSSMNSITGVEWKSGNTDLWSKYSSTLGVPDYIENMTEDLTASVIFQKFLNDAAVYSCQQWIDNDLSSSEKSFFVYVTSDDTEKTSVMNNIEYLRYLIHGQRSVENDPFVDSIWELYFLVHQRTEDNVNAWNTLCVAMFTHPEFYTY